MLTMPGPFDELEKEAETLEKRSKEEFTNKNFISAISLLEEAKEISTCYDQGWVRSPRSPQNMGQHENLALGT